MITALLMYLIIINLIAFLLMGEDKRRAKNDSYRISEGNLLLIAFLGGSLGALSGMYVFSHKTSKRKFTLTVPIFMVLHTVLFFALMVMNNL